MAMTEYPFFRNYYGLEGLMSANTVAIVQAAVVS